MRQFLVSMSQCRRRAQQLSSRVQTLRRLCALPVSVRTSIALPRMDSDWTAASPSAIARSVFCTVHSFPTASTTLPPVHSAPRCPHGARSTSACNSISCALISWPHLLDQQFHVLQFQRCKTESRFFPAAYHF